MAVLFIRAAAVPHKPLQIDSGGQGSSPQGFCTYGSKMYFSGYRNKWGFELFVYGGTNPATIVDIYPGLNGSRPTGLLAYNGKIYFSADNGTTGRELYAYDTLTQTAALVKDIYTGSGSSNPVIGLVANNKLYFAAMDSVYGNELYAYDGTTVSRLTDLTPGKGSGVYKRFTPANALYRGLGYLNGNIYFSGATDSLNYSLYQYNIGSGSTKMMKKLTISYEFAELNGKLYFAAADTIPAQQMWMTDGTNVSQLPDINRYGARNSFIKEFCVWNNVLYFQANDSTHGSELFRLTDASGVEPVFKEATTLVYPNPTSGDATLAASVRLGGTYRIDILDVLGRSVWFGSQDFAQGTTSIKLPMGNLASGTYYYRLYNQQKVLQSGGKIIRR